jgi:hypothetical protein
MSERQTLCIAAAIAVLLALVSPMAAAETPEEHKNPTTAPAKSVELPQDKYISQICVSPNGRFLMVELTTAIRPRQMHEVRLFDVGSGNSFSLTHIFPDYSKLDSEKTGPWLASVGDDGKALILLQTYPERVGVNRASSHRVLCVDVKDKRLLHDKTFKELDKGFIFRTTRIGSEWWMTVLDTDEGPVVMALDCMSGKLRTLPYNGGCQGVFSNGDPLLAVDPDQPDAKIKNTDIKRVAWFVRLNRADKSLTRLAPWTEELLGWSHLARMSADGKRLGFCSTTKTDKGNEYHIGVLDISEGRKDPTVLWKKEIPGDKNEWPVFLPVGVTNGGTLILSDVSQKRIAAMKADGSTTTFAENIEPTFVLTRCPFITPKRLWYVQQGNRKEGKPPTLHSIDVEAIDR